MSFSLGVAALGLAEFVPVITKWLGGPRIESMTQRIINIAKEISENDDISDVIDTLKKDPNKALEFQRAVYSLETEIEMALVHDRQEARKRELLMVESGRSTKRADVMVFSAVLGLGFCLCALGFYGKSLPGEAIGIISTISGIFGACLKDAYAFEFGSSRGSRQKDETMAAMIDQL